MRTEQTEKTGKPAARAEPEQTVTTSPLWLWCPLKVESFAAKRGAKNSQVTQSGMGTKKSQAFIGELTKQPAPKDQPPADAPSQIVIAGFGGGLLPTDRPGDVVVASRVMGPGQTFEFPHAEQLAQQLSAQFKSEASQGDASAPSINVRTGVIYSSDHVVMGKHRQELAQTGAEVVEMESWWLLDALNANSNAKNDAGAKSAQVPFPKAVVRVLLDTPQKSLLGTVSRLRPVSKVLSATAAALEAVSLNKSGILKQPAV